MASERTRKAQAKAGGEAPRVRAWRIVDRIQLGLLLGVHPDTITDYARQGMPVMTAGGRGRVSEYDSVDCGAWWRERQGKNAKEAAQTRLYEGNAQLAELKIAKEEGRLLDRDEVVRDGQVMIKGWAAVIRSLPRRLRHRGTITRPDQEADVVQECRNVLLEIAAWKVAPDVKRSMKAADAA